MTKTAVYYAGFDPGSGDATLYLSSADGLEPGQSILSIPSFIADGDAAGLLEVRNLAGRTLPKVLHDGEYVIQYQEQDYYVGRLAIKDGTNPTNALGDKGRYTGLHSQLLLFALVAAMIPESNIELRLVTALPVKLFDKESRQAVKRNLEGYYTFIANGIERELVVKVGAVIMEGQGVLLHRSNQAYDEQAVIDIGERTMDLVAIDGRGTPLKKYCGGTELGVGQIIDDLIEGIRVDHQKKITTSLAHNILRAYAHGETLPVVRLGAEKTVNPEIIVRLIEQSIAKVGRSINAFISAKWNVEGAAIGSNFDAIYVAGGGAYYFAEIIKRDLMGVTVTDSPEQANVQGYHILALGLESIKATIWG